jgi:uncharacterized protein (DUF1786 family)
MKILAVDVGVGTQDIMLYNSKESIENSPKLVLPSSTRIFAKKIRNYKENLFITGETMGGGPINKAIKEHLKKGYKIVMNENSARTIKDDLEYVKSLGIKIIQNGKNYPHSRKIELKDVDLYSIEHIFSQFCIDFKFDFLGVAVQDHGFMKGLSDRNFRFNKIKELLNIPKRPEELAFFDGAPAYFTRMNGVLRAFKNYRTIVMDSKFASICGATCDDYVKDLERFIVIDVGNGHTMAAAFDQGKIYGVFEHHTHLLNPQKIEIYIDRLVKGTLTHQEVYEDGGHGAWVLGPIDDFESIIATGPRRKMLRKTNYEMHFAAPAGDVMMTGPLGLIKSIKSKFQ